MPEDVKPSPVQIVYEPPRLIELGPFEALTQAEGRHVGKLAGGSDAFLLTGRGNAIVTTSV